MSARQQTSRETLYQSLINCEQFYVKVGDELFKVSYNTGLETDLYVCFVSSEPDKQASIGRVHRMLQDTVDITATKHGGGDSQCSFIVPYSRVRAVLIKQQQGVWRLCMHTTYRGSEKTTEIIVDTNLEKLVEMQQGLMRRAKKADAPVRYSLVKIK